MISHFYFYVRCNIETLYYTNEKLALFTEAKIYVFKRNKFFCQRINKITIMNLKLSLLNELIFIKTVTAEIIIPSFFFFFEI